jgi:hypothetical protein
MFLECPNDRTRYAKSKEVGYQFIEPVADRYLAEQGSGDHTPREFWSSTETMRSSIPSTLLASHPFLAPRGYAEAPGFEPEMQQVMHPLAHPRNSLGAEITRILRGSQDGYSNQVHNVPPPPAPFHCKPVHDDMPASIGSVGHPYTCAKGCKYVWKKRGCRDGRDCPHCHLCTPNAQKQHAKPSPPSQQEPQGRALGTNDKCQPCSIGSIGHPHSCAPACKYNGKKAGCKDGRLCNRCHICRWSRCADRNAKEASNATETTTREMSTQTTVDSSTQCDLSQEEAEMEAELDPPDLHMSRFSV